MFPFAATRVSSSSILPLCVSLSLSLFMSLPSELQLLFYSEGMGNHPRAGVFFLCSTSYSLTLFLLASCTSHVLHHPHYLFFFLLLALLIPPEQGITPVRGCFFWLSTSRPPLPNPSLPFFESLSWCPFPLAPSSSHGSNRKVSPPCCHSTSPSFNLPFLP